MTRKKIDGAPLPFPPQIVNSQSRDCASITSTNGSEKSSEQQEVVVGLFGSTCKFHGAVYNLM